MYLSIFTSPVSRAKAVYLPKHMIVAPATNALPHIIYARNHEPDNVDEPKLDNTTHANGKRVKTSHGRLSTRRGPRASAGSKHRQFRPFNPTADEFSGPERKTDTEQGMKLLVTREKTLNDNDEYQARILNSNICGTDTR